MEQCWSGGAVFFAFVIGCIITACALQESDEDLDDYEEDMVALKGFDIKEAHGKRWYESTSKR